MRRKLFDILEGDFRGATVYGRVMTVLITAGLLEEIEKKEK